MTLPEECRNPRPVTTPSGAVRLPGFAEIVFVKPAGIGGSTKAAALVASGQLPAEAVVNLDNIRFDLTGDMTNHTREREVASISNQRCEVRLAAGLVALRDGTHLHRSYRAESIQRAHRQGAAAVALLRKANFTFEELRARNRSRSRVVPDEGSGRENVLQRHYDQHRSITAEGLYAEGFDLVVEWDDATEFYVLPDSRGVLNPDPITGEPLRVLTQSDVHGCWHTQLALLADHGLHLEGGGFDEVILASVGDVHDKGGARAAGDFGTGEPTDSGSLNCLRLWLWLVRTGRGIWIRGNHEDKLARTLAGKTSPAFSVLGIGDTLADLQAQPDAAELRHTLEAVLSRLPLQVVSDTLVIAHAAARAELLGRHDRKAAGVLLYQRDDTCWDGPATQTLVHGHVIVDEVRRFRRVNAEGELCGEVVNIDTGAYKGGGLTTYDSFTGRTHTTSTDPRDFPPAALMAAHEQEVREFFAQREQKVSRRPESCTT